MRGSIVGMGLLLTCAACGDPLNEPHQVGGTWLGRIEGFLNYTNESFGATFTFALDESGGTVSGSAGALQVSGTHRHPDVSLVIEQSNSGPIALVLTCAGKDKMEGLAYGGGIGQATATLRRQ